MLVDLGSIMMAVSLEITGKGGYVPVWQKFLDCMEDRALQKYGKLILPTGEDTTELEVDAELAVYGAWSDWDDWSDPLWFPDSESLTAFVLMWS